MTHSIRLLTPEEQAQRAMLDSIHPTISSALAPYVAPYGSRHNGVQYATFEDAQEARRRDRAALEEQFKQNRLMRLEGWPV